MVAGTGVRLIEPDEHEARLAAASPVDQPPIEERGLLAINYTSGTTGRPKDVMYRHRGAFLQAVAMCYHARLGPDTRYLWTLPMFHCNGWSFTRAVTAAGGTHVCLRSIDVAEIWWRLSADGVTHLSAAPTVLTMIAETPAAAPLTNGRTVHVDTGGAPRRRPCCWSSRRTWKHTSCAQSERTVRDAIWAEALKARRSRLPWLTSVALGLAAAVGALFMFILQDPARARAIGLLGAKAQLAGGVADWPGHFALLAQITAVGGMLVFGVILIWTFGREFSDRTAKDLLALPTSRAQIVAAKFTVAAIWCALLAVQTVLLGLVAGALLRLPGWTPSVAFAGLGRLAAALTWLLLSVLALAASTGRGYLAAVGVMFVLVFLAQIVATLGYGHVFPWSVLGVYSGLAGPGRGAVGPVGLAAVIVVGLAGLAGTVVWWRHADQSR